jgi:hypothetical protein
MLGINNIQNKNILRKTKELKKMTEKQINQLITENISKDSTTATIVKMPFELNLGTVNIQYEICLS